jgi:hypothetical protein
VGRWFFEAGAVRIFAGVSGCGGLLVVADGRRTNAVQFAGFSRARKVLSGEVKNLFSMRKTKNTSQ